MAILAGYVPWHIGVEAYGRFAALFALPGLVQSSFEVVCVAILSEHRRRDMLQSAILFFVLPLYGALVMGFLILLDLSLALPAAIMAALLLARSYAFSIAIVSATLTKKILQSEAMTFVVYAVVAVYCVIYDVRSEFMPIAMVSLASLATAIFLIHASQAPAVVLPGNDDGSRPRIPVATLARAASLRFFEDGYLTLSPLVLASLLSPATAGQFRIFVSVAKAAYKFFPFRYEVILRELNRGALRFRPLAVSCVVFLTLGLLGAAVVHASGGPRDVLMLFSSAGAVAASLAIFPAASLVDGRVLPLAVVGLLAMFGAAYVFGSMGFVIVFSLANATLLIAALVAIGRAGR